MRAREFTINIPINIKINGDGEPEIDVAGAKDDSELDPQPIAVPPLQQDLELKKAAVGKQSPVIDRLTRSEVDADADQAEVQVGDPTATGIQPDQLSDLKKTLSLLLSNPPSMP